VAETDETGRSAPRDRDPDAALARLRDVMAALRTPGTGCPWDLEQSFSSIAPYTIEEAYEVADAIARGDMGDLCEELGDLLLQVVYHSRLAEEAGAFALPDVIAAITAKMIRRHPHVFGDAEARSAGMAKDWWERIKAEEKAARAARRHGKPEELGASPPITDREERGNRAETPATSLLAGIPLGLPGLTRALALQARAAGVGFDWPSLMPVLSKLREEIGELEEVVIPLDPRGDAAARAPSTTDVARATDELGDLLFVVANVARHLGIDPEAALRGANAKFERRFNHIERSLAERGSAPARSTLEEMDALWNEAKARERHEPGTSTT
jgi:ATP diphosphatase